MPNRPRNPRAIAYVRVINRVGYACLFQQLVVELIAAREGLDVVRWFFEVGVPNDTEIEKRETLQAAVRAIADGTASVVVAPDLGGLAASASELGEIAVRIERAGGLLYAYSQPKRWV